MVHLRALHARFPCGSGTWCLNLAALRSSPDRSTKSTRSGTCGPPTVCGHRVSGSLSLPSRGPFHLSFTVLCSIGHWGYSALRGGPRVFPQGFTCPVVLWILPRLHGASLTGLSPSPAGLPRAVLLRLHLACAVLNPKAHAPWFGLLRFRSPLLPESSFLSFPPAT